MTTVDHLVGRTMPGGRMQVDPHEDWLMRDVALAAPAWAPTLHPLSVFAGLQRSIGISLADFFAVCGSSSEDGPMLGETRIEVLEPMVPGQPYAVRATITASDRKDSRSAGPIDIVELSIDAYHPGDGDGLPVARVVNSYIFRRPAP